jgi:hypothetical protein
MVSSQTMLLFLSRYSIYHLICNFFTYAMTVMTLVERLRESIRAHLNDNRVGEILRDGIHITISGPPNAGKSSFLNTLGKIPLHDIYLLMHRI